MATIYQKSITGGFDQCVILNRFEGIQYELPNEIKEWNDLRIGMILSLTNESEDNGLYNHNSECSNLTFNPTNTAWIGLKTNNNIFPGNDGCAYIGVGTTSPSVNTHQQIYNPYYPTFDVGSINSYSQGAVPFIMGSGNYTNSSYKVYNGSYHRNTSFSYGSFLLDYNYNMTGAATPVIPFAMRFTKISGNAINYNYKGSCHAYIVTPISNTSTEYLKTFISNFSFTESPANVFQKVSNSTSADSADPYTTDGTNSGISIPTPDSFFIYWPFAGQRLRIHNFIVEKYA